MFREIEIEKYLMKRSRTRVAVLEIYQWFSRNARPNSYVPCGKLGFLKLKSLVLFRGHCR